MDVRIAVNCVAQQNTVYNAQLVSGMLVSYLIIMGTISRSISANCLIVSYPCGLVTAAKFYYSCQVTVISFNVVPIKRSRTR